MARPDQTLELPPLPPTSRASLTGPNEPLRSEAIDDGPFVVTGTVPPGVDGMLVLVGPNPVILDDPETYDAALGSGMVHAVTFDRGRPLDERSRFVVTRVLVDRLGMSPVPSGPLSAGGPVANRSVVVVARRLLALDGMGLGYRLSTSLATVSVEDFDGMLSTSMGTQVEIDPSTGDASFLGVDPWRRPLLHLYELRGDGLLSSSTSVPMSPVGLEPALGATEGLRFFVESSVRSTVDPETGRGTEELRFEADRPALLGLLPLERSGDDARWCDLAPGHVHQTLCANNTANGIDVTAIRSAPSRHGDHEWRPTAGMLERLVVDGPHQRVSVEPLDDVEVVGACIDVAEGSHRRRHGYATTVDQRTVIKYNLRTGGAQRVDLEPSLLGSRPVFIRDIEGRSDDEGWLLVSCYDRREQGTSIVIFDASSFSAGPVATVRLPHRLSTINAGTFVPADLFR